MPIIYEYSHEDRKTMLPIFSCVWSRPNYTRESLPITHYLWSPATCGQSLKTHDCTPGTAGSRIGSDVCSLGVIRGANQAKQRVLFLDSTPWLVPLERERAGEKERERYRGIERKRERERDRDGENERERKTKGERERGLER